MRFWMRGYQGWGLGKIPHLPAIFSYVGQLAFLYRKMYFRKNNVHSSMKPFYSLINYRNQPKILVQFTLNTEWNNRLKKVPGAQWSRTYKGWVIPDTAENRQKCKLPPLHLPVVQTTKAVTQQQVNRISTANHQQLQLFIQQLQLKAYSPSTLRTYTNEFMQLLQVLVTIPVQDLQPQHLQRYLIHCLKSGLTENTLHSRINALKFYYEQVLHREKFFWEIPRPKKPQKLPKVISEEKIIQGLMTVDNIKHKTILLLAYSAGLRVSEVVQLKVTDINSDRMQITVHHAKGKKDRVVTLSASILLLLRAYYKEYKPSSWLFEGQYPGEHYSVRSAQSIFKQAYQQLNLPPSVSFHSLRHSYATHLLENGTDISYIQKLLGHADIKTTLRYADVSNRDIGKIESPLDKILRKKRV